MVQRDLDKYTKVRGKGMIYLIKSAVASLYAEPDEQSTRVDEVLYGMEVEVESEKSGEYGDEGWLYVCTSYRYQGWIQRCHLICCDLSHSNQIRYVTVPAADVLAAPKVQAPLLICLTLGGIITLISEESSGWAKVALVNGRIGYIRSAFLAAFPIKASRESVCRAVSLYLGAQYRWGGKTPLGVDCSGLCFMAYWLNGISIYRDARIEPGFPVKEISPDRAQKGDLLFFPGHVGMLLGENVMIHSSEANNGVKIEAVTQEWKERVVGVGSVFDMDV